MKIFKVRELLRYSRETLFNYLDEESIGKLISLNMLRRFTKKDRYEAADLLGESLDDISDTNSDFYVFKYVGILTIKNICLISYPKYIKNFSYTYDSEHKIIKELIDVIRKYESINQRQALLGYDKEVDEFNLLAFTMDLLVDYYYYGLYSNDQDIIELNGQGNILWDKTIAEQPMYISNGAPVYLDLYTENKDVNYGDFVRRLHACVLTKVTQELKNVLNILGIDIINLSESEVADFGDDSYIIYRLYQEYTRQFETRKQNVINKLIDYINKSKMDYVKSNISFVGTTSMNMVWESVCATVYGDCRKKTLKELSLVHPADGKLSDTIEDLMPKPLWTHYSSRKEHEVKDTLILDLIVIKDGIIEIYDAKYYNIQFDEHGIKKQPGIGDITKQYLYQKAYEPLAKANKMKIAKNAFLMPTEDEEQKLLGKVSIDLFNEDELLSIETILLPVRKMFYTYLSS